MHLRPTSPPGSPALSSYERISDTEVLFYKQLRPYFMAVIPSPIFIVIPFHIPFHITFPPPPGPWKHHDTVTKQMFAFVSCATIHSHGSPQLVLSPYGRYLWTCTSGSNISGSLRVFSPIKIFKLPCSDLRSREQGNLVASAFLRVLLGTCPHLNCSVLPCPARCWTVSSIGGFAHCPFTSDFNLPYALPSALSRLSPCSFLCWRTEICQKLST